MTQQNNFGEELLPYTYLDDYCESEWSSVEVVVERPDKTLFIIPDERVMKGTTSYSWYWQENELSMAGKYRVQCIFRIGSQKINHGRIQTFNVRENLI